MKLFIRGMGVGMLITTLIVAIAYGISGSNINDSEIRRRAEALGMTKRSDTIFTTHSPQEDDISAQAVDVSAQAASPSAVTETTEGGQEQVYTLLVRSGESSYTICKRLEDAGLINSAVEMDSYMRKKNYQRKVQIGEFQIEKGMTYEQIADKIAK